MARRSKKDIQVNLSPQEYTKNVVDLVNKIVESKDYIFAEDETRNKMSNLILGLIHSFKDNPTFVAAIIQFLTENGYKMNMLRGDVYKRFGETFNYKIASITDEEKNKLREITAKLFMDNVKA